MVSMARNTAEKEEMAEEMLPSPADIPDYPFGLSISLCQDELEKLNLETTDFEVGDLVHFHAMATVTSISSNANQTGNNCRIELQIIAMSAEDEDEENEEDDEQEDKAVKLHTLYKS